MLVPPGTSSKGTPARVAACLSSPAGECPIHRVIRITWSTRPRWSAARKLSQRPLPVYFGAGTRSIRAPGGKRPCSRPSPPTNAIFSSIMCTSAVQLEDART